MRAGGGLDRGWHVRRERHGTGRSAPMELAHRGGAVSTIVRVREGAVRSTKNEHPITVQVERTCRRYRASSLWSLRAYRSFLYGSQATTSSICGVRRVTCPVLRLVDASGRTSQYAHWSSSAAVLQPTTMSISALLNAGGCMRTVSAVFARRVKPVRSSDTLFIRHRLGRRWRISELM